MYRFGFGSTNTVESHPSDNNTICIYVHGGISFTEINQIYMLLQSRNDDIVNEDFRIIIISNDIIMQEDIVGRINSC